MAQLCERIEMQLAAYASDELSDEEARRVRAHVKACTACAESLDAYRRLEMLLAERRAERPPAAQTAKQVAARLGFQGEWTVVRALTGFPGWLSSALIVAGVLGFFVEDVFRRGAAAWSAIVVQAPPVAVEGLTHVLLRATGDEAWVQVTLYAGVSLLVCLTGGWMVLRYVRD